MLHQPAEAFRPSTGECPVAEMGRVFQRHVDIYNHLDAEKEKDQKTTFGRDSQAAFQSHMSIGDAAPFMQARSAEGALFQVILASGAAASIIGVVPEENNEDYSYIVSLARELDASLTSVRRFMETHFAIDGLALGGEYHMPDRCSVVPRLERVNLEGSTSSTTPRVPKASPVEEIAADYDRWHDLYLKTGDLQETDRYKSDAAFKDEVDHADRASVSHMKEMFLKLRITPSRNLRDVGLKARIVHEFQHNAWYGDGGSGVDNGEKLAAVLVSELMAMNGLGPMPRRDRQISDYLPSLAMAAE